MKPAGGPRDEEPPKDRGAVTFVRSPDERGRRRAEDLRHRSHDSLRQDRRTGVLELSLEAVDALHVGSGVATVMETRAGSELVRGLMVNRRDSEEGLPVVPGTSLKGVVRGLVEVVAGGCDVVQGCGWCYTCGLFGFAGGRGESFAARVGFEDAEAAPDVLVGLARLPTPRRPQQSKGRRLYSQPEQVSLGEAPYEVIGKGEVLRGRMHLTNVTEAELGMVLLAMGCDGSFPLRVGGGKFGGLGRVRCAVEGARLRQGYRAPVPAVLEREAAQALAVKLMDGARAALDARGRAALEQVRLAHTAQGGGA